MNARAQFTRKEDCAAADWQSISGEPLQFPKTLPRRLMWHQELLDRDHGGFPVDRYTHALQTAAPKQLKAR